MIGVSAVSCFTCMPSYHIMEVEHRKVKWFQNGTKVLEGGKIIAALFYLASYLSLSSITISISSFFDEFTRYK